MHFCSSKSSIRVTTTGNNDVYKTKWKNANKEYNENYICCVFYVFKSAIMYKSGRVVLSRISVYFAINKLILLFSYYFHVPCIILYKVYFYIARSTFSLVLNRSQSKASVQMSNLFLKLKYVFLLFSMF